MFSLSWWVATECFSPQRSQRCLEQSLPKVVPQQWWLAQPCPDQWSGTICSQELIYLFHSLVSQTSTDLLNPCVPPWNSITACCHWLLHVWNVCIWNCDVHYPWDFALEVFGLKKQLGLTNYQILLCYMSSGILKHSEKFCCQRGLS